ncbi:hypothetical protein Bca52824_006763 [Brassica carinata]|uniref:Uncharacterized protein n=1 Tax=Brassica carinata TaxID=52824 RepID=A0A8X7W7V9_BRACI|nr:hypothetical protein Bca52824_006763 [Brassica carinata]
MVSRKCSSTVEARLLRFWEARNVKRGGELMWVDMLMVDVNLIPARIFMKHFLALIFVKGRKTVMQATIGDSRLTRFRHKLTAGKVYTVSGFDVARVGITALGIRCYSRCWSSENKATIMALGAVSSTMVCVMLIVLWKVKEVKPLNQVTALMMGGTQARLHHRRKLCTLEKKARTY